MSPHIKWGVEVEASELGADNELMKDALAEDIVEITCEAWSEFREDGVFKYLTNAGGLSTEKSSAISDFRQRRPNAPRSSSSRPRFDMAIR
jgi:hypothetical protein